MSAHCFQIYETKMTVRSAFDFEPCHKTDILTMKDSMFPIIPTINMTGK